MQKSELSRTGGCANGQQAIQCIQQRGGPLALGHIDIHQGADLVGQTDIGGEQENRDVRFGLAHPPGDLAAMHSGHGIVEDDRIYGLVRKQFEAGMAILGGQDAIAGALQKDLSDVQANYFIVHAQNQMRFVVH
jgi:hypothetical protein